ncbi:MAG: helix-turn-helix domain-containing protein [Pontibacterium sp.]
MATLKNQTPIPITDFYGETTTWPVEDLVHCEHLGLRSAKYNWKIKPHRHLDLLQIFFVLKGQGSAQVDNHTLTVNTGDLLVIPENCVHMFLWETGSDGFVLAIARPLLSKLAKVLDNPMWCYGEASVYSSGENEAYLSALLSAINDEHAGTQSFRQLQMENHVLALAIWITRQNVRQHEVQKQTISRSEQRLSRFIDLLENNFDSHHNVDWYAEKVGVTSAHLNEICKKRRNQTALGLIHQRILTEAQRHLIFTIKPASDIAMSLGFSDPAYFSRFFKRLTGSTPKQFRDNKVPL